MHVSAQKSKLFRFAVVSKGLFKPNALLSHLQTQDESKGLVQSHRLGLPRVVENDIAAKKAPASAWIGFRCLVL